MPVGQDPPPPSPEEAAKSIARWADDVDGLTRQWRSLTAKWAETDERARRLGEVACQQRVGNEWSYVETLRHVVFVVDAWIGRTVHGRTEPYHREALPPTFLPDLSALGIDTTMSVSLEDAIVLRRDSEAVVTDLLAGLDDDSLSRVCNENPAKGFPPVTSHTVLRCVKTVLNEADAHHGFATRDLAVLETG